MSRIDTLPEGFAALIGQQQLRVGDIVAGRYRLVQSLGLGGMGHVFVAENIAIGMRVAVKLLKPELLANPEFRKRFQNEAQAVAAIDHPNVARFFDLVVGDPTFIVMEYVRGSTLSDLLKLGPLPVERAVAIARRLCWGLHAAHAAGVVHRDLKPANVLLKPDAEAGETPKLIDFGLAKLAAAVGDSQLTRTGQIIGTPQYMSPEQITGREIDGRADVYSLGCVIYEMVTGQTPFSGGTDDVQILYRQMHETPAPPSAKVPSLPPALDAVLARALQKDPEARHASMRELAEALDTVVAPSVPSLPRPAPPPPRSSRALLAWALASTLLLVAGAGLGVVRWRGVVAPSRGAGLLVVTTQPPGASVTLDGRALDEATPTAARGVGAGAHELRLVKAGYAPVERTVTLAEAERQAVEIALPPVTRHLEVSTVPAGASLYVDGHLSPATTPTTVALTEDDFHELRVERDGYETLTRAIKPEDHEPSLTLTLSPERQPRGTLVVEANDVAEVWVDGVPTGFTTPTLAFRVAEGEHAIELHAPTGERSTPRRIRIARGQTLRISMALK